MEPSHRKCTYCGGDHNVSDCLAEKLKLRSEARREQLVKELDKRLSRGDFTVLPPYGPGGP